MFKNKKLVDKVEAVIDDWKKENPNGKVTIEMPGQCITVKLSDANIYVDPVENLIFDAE